MSDPPAVVSVDGRVLGQTPRQIRLPAGLHSVTVDDPDRGLQTVSVNVLGGKSVTVMLRP
jgi:hypothetical protein